MRAVRGVLERLAFALVGLILGVGLAVFVDQVL